MRNACREIIQKIDHTPRHYAESPYVTYRTKISASSALSGMTPSSLVVKEGGNSRILVLNDCPLPLGYRARLLISTASLASLSEQWSLLCKCTVETSVGNIDIYVITNALMKSDPSIVLV